MLLKDSSPAAIIKKHTGCEGDFYEWKGMFFLLSGVKHTVFLRVAFLYNAVIGKGLKERAFNLLLRQRTLLHISQY